MGTFLMSEAMRIVVVVLIVVAAFAVVFGLAAIILWNVLLRLEKKVYRAFDEFVPHEKHRAEVIGGALDYIDTNNHKLKGKQEFLTEFRTAVDQVTTAESPDDLCPLKDTMDFAVLYCGKLLKERGKGPEAKQIAKELDDIKADTDQASQAYTKAAAQYNSVLAMWPTKLANRLHRKKNRRKQISQL